MQGLRLRSIPIAKGSPLHDNDAMERKVPFVVGEHYHIYTRGVDKMVVCKGESDFGRLQLLLYLCNSTTPVNMRELLSKYKGEPLVKLFEHQRKETLVEIAAYALMPNHLHLLLREKIDDGVSRFMLKLMTAYSMYFNTRYERSGPLFTRPFRSRHIDDDDYLRWLFSYIHGNPVDRKHRRYTSYVDYFEFARPESRLLESSLYSRDEIRAMDYKGEPFVGYNG